MIAVLILLAVIAVCIFAPLVLVYHTIDCEQCGNCHKCAQRTIGA